MRQLMVLILLLAACGCSQKPDTMRVRFVNHTNHTLGVEYGNGVFESSGHFIDKDGDLNYEINVDSEYRGTPTFIVKEIFKDAYVHPWLDPKCPKYDDKEPNP